MDIIKEFFNGSRLALSRAISLVENEDLKAQNILRKVYQKTGKAHVVGITGAPGSGKSTLTDCLAKAYRQDDKKIGIIAVDPTSPFTGGAILGDRIRMNDLTTDSNVFIRSMGTRGSLGGVALKTAEVIKLMDAFGMDVIFVETVGVGQSEVDIVKYADTVLVVLTPGLGDDIQAIKAGILEIADIFVINKADAYGVEKLEAELNMMLDLGGNNERLLSGGLHHLMQGISTLKSKESKAWRTKIVKTVASVQEGIKLLIKTIDEYQLYAQNTGVFAKRRLARTGDEVIQALQGKVFAFLEQNVFKSEHFKELVEKVAKKESDPYSVVEGLWEDGLFK